MIDRKKFAALKKKIVRERGDLWMFALILREDAEDKWDLVIAAPWVGEDKAPLLHYLSQRLKNALTKRELLYVSRIVLLDASNPALDAIWRAAKVTKGGLAELVNVNFFGFEIKHALVFESKRPEVAVGQEAVQMVASAPEAPPNLPASDS